MRSGEEFALAVRRGRRAGRRTLVVHLNRSASLQEPTATSASALASASASQEPTKVGFVVSKAVGSAVVRNRVKRQLRHLTRERIETLPAGMLMVVRANPAAAGAGVAGPKGLAADLDSALRALSAAKSETTQHRRDQVSS